MKKISHYLSFALLALIFLVEPSFSAESKVGAETQYVFNTLLFSPTVNAGSGGCSSVQR